MSLAGLLSVIAADPQLQRALSQGDADTDLVAPPALRPFLAASIAGYPSADQPRFVLAVTATAREAEVLTSGLESLLPEGTVAYFPAWETLPHERLSPRSDTSGRRLAVLRRLAHPDAGSVRSGALSVLVTPVRSLLQPMVSGLGDLDPVALQSGQAADFEEVIAHLVDIGYARTDLVEHRGEIAVRGGILDVFPPTEEHPLRVEFWGDTVEEIRYFRAATSAVCTRPRRGCGHRPAGSCCSRRRCASGPGDSRRNIQGWPKSWANWRTASRSRAWKRSRQCWPTGWNYCSTTSPRVAWSWPAIPSGSGPGPMTWSGPARSSSTPPG